MTQISASVSLSISLHLFSASDDFSISFLLNYYAHGEVMHRLISKSYIV